MIGALTLDQLRVLVAVADTGSFSAAGRQLGRVQSAVSQTVQTLEDIQGIQLFDRSGHKPQLTPQGRNLLEHVRLVLISAGRFEAVAASARAGLKPELAVAIDPLVPTPPLIASLRDLKATFPDLPVRFWTEGVGGAERRLKEGSAALGVCLLLPAVPPELTAYPLMDLELVPVVAPDHPLASLGRPSGRADLEPYVQLVLSDPLGPVGSDYGVVGSRVWRFIDLGRRLDFLLAGFGWCKMPRHVMTPMLDDGRLVAFTNLDESVMPSSRLMIYAAHARDRPLGKAGAWLLEALRRQLDLADST